MEFKQFKGLMQGNFNQMLASAVKLFEVNLDKDALWELYLNSFPEGTNPVFKERREYDCTCCKQFIRNFGNVVTIENNVVRSVWDFQTNDTTFQPVIDALNAFVVSHPVSDIYVTKFAKIGTDKNYQMENGVKINEWHHFYVELPKQFVDKSNDSEAEVQGAFRDIRNVFKRSLDELTEESVLTVLELIASNSLYKGEENKYTLTEFLKYKKQYDKLKTSTAKENYAWEQTIKVNHAIGKIRNTSIGTLLINLSEGMDLDTAVTKYEKVVAPENYKRPKAIYTQRMLDDAKKTVEELGYYDALPRRYATLEDISVNNILYSNKDVAKRLRNNDFFTEMSKDVVLNPKKFSKVEEISIDKFIEDILPTASEVGVYLENKHAPNFVSVTAPVNKDAKSMFKWDNPYAWGYTGNITDSSMKENVKSAGGKVDGVLRFSIQWNDGTVYNQSDLDAHCDEPTGYRIYFPNKRMLSPTGGMLDVDIVSPTRNVPAVENITWANTDKMKEGVYRFYVNPFSRRGGNSDGFKSEIEFNGHIYTFECKKDIKERTLVAEVTYNKVTGFSIKEYLPSSVSSKDIWNLKTNQFVPVSVVCYSPNYWNEQRGIGHKHYFFMLKDCINSESPNGFYNEFLKEDLMKHKRVFEALGSKMSVQHVEDQLSGIGFSSTKRNELVVKVKGATERVVKIKF
jgi:hypothetical protein